MKETSAFPLVRSNGRFRIRCIFMFLGLRPQKGRGQGHARNVESRAAKCGLRRRQDKSVFSPHRARLAGSPAINGKSREWLIQVLVASGVQMDAVSVGKSPYPGQKREQGKMRRIKQGANPWPFRRAFHRRHESP